VKRTHLFTLVSMAVLAMLLLSACGTETAPTATPATSGSTGNAGSSASGGLPKLAKKDKYKVGFSQTVSDNPWRLAETQSMKDEAAKRGWEIVVTDAGGSAAKQVADVDSLIAQ
jgi:ribose transport system substrate-binding protein